METDPQPTTRRPMTLNHHPHRCLLDLLVGAYLTCLLWALRGRQAKSGEPGACDALELQSGLEPRCALRGALHHSLLHCVGLRRLLEAHGCVLGGASSTISDSLVARSREHGCSLDPAHILVLAHVLRRPIICYASATVGERRALEAGRTFSSYAADGKRMSGIYLPTLLPPECPSPRAPPQPPAPSSPLVCPPYHPPVPARQLTPS